MPDRIAFKLESPKYAISFWNIDIKISLNSDKIGCFSIFCISYECPPGVSFGINSLEYLGQQI